MLPVGPTHLGFRPENPVSWEPSQAGVNQDSWSPHIWPVCPNPILTLNIWVCLTEKPLNIGRDTPSCNEIHDKITWRGNAMLGDNKWEWQRFPPCPHTGSIKDLAAETEMF